MKVKLQTGTYTLDPEDPNQNTDFSVEINGDNLEDWPLEDRVWNPDRKQYEAEGTSGWVYWWVFRDDGTYIHGCTSPSGVPQNIDAGTYQGPQ